ncbi:hypothetical protein Dsin_021789 [Dipteronia sinensis]|uniref:HAT C-terminal dimerisation domain-containing protein n=1 Tax=Dipteronia sinensis TaxID=43782 RepID=A0AAE0A0U3_9ROSI|nr:hypothetical protein Dsin_021789 [Dipteronia sinensis]
MKGKGRMTDNLGHDDHAYHEYLQQQVYAEDLGLNFPHSHPSLRISEPDLNVTPILTSQSENMPDLGHDGDEHDDPDPNPYQDFDFYPQMEEKLSDYLSVYYEQEDTEDKKFDILHWWKEHERYFPILATIAKQILSTPVSTVAVEQQFSAGGNILDPRHSLMSPKSLQIQACVEDWTKAQNRQQEIDQEEPYDFFKDDQPAESRMDDHGND